MLIMAHMCTSLSIMRLKTCFFWLLSDSRSIEGSVENILCTALCNKNQQHLVLYTILRCLLLLQKILILPQSVCMDSCNIYIDSRQQMQQMWWQDKEEKRRKSINFLLQPIHLGIQALYLLLQIYNGLPDPDI